MLALLSLTPLSACGGPTTSTGDADLVLLGGPVITVDPEDSVAEAVAIRDGRILAVGSVAEIAELAGPDTERIDLGGRAVTPGLLDAHAHFGWGGAERLYVLDLSYPNVESIADVTAAVATQIEALEPDAWVEGRGWDEGKLDELRYIYAADLDAVAPRNPVWLSHTMGHYGVANSVALEMAGITADTPDPAGGTIDRDGRGQPTGVLKESAQGLVSRLIPPMSADQQREGIRALAAAFNEEGMTGLKDPGINQATWDAYADVLDDGDLTVRVFALWGGPASLEGADALIERVGETTKPYLPGGDDQLVSGGVKMYVDGSGGARTAWLHEEWNRDRDGVDAGNYGYPVIDPDRLRALIRRYHDAGIHVSVHSIGDRGIDWVVDSYVAALEANPVHGLRHGIIHANIPSDRALDAIAAMQRDHDAAIPEPSATFMWWIGDTYAGNFGPERSQRLNPFRSFQERGIIWADGSDYNVTPFPARYGLWASIARETLLGVYGAHPYGTDEAIDVRTALRSRTIWAARQMFLEDRIGSIEPGKFADLAVWDRDPYRVPTEQLREMRCELTIFQGEVVYRR